MYTRKMRTSALCVVRALGFVLDDWGRGVFMVLPVLQLNGWEAEDKGSRCTCFQNRAVSAHDGLPVGDDDPHVGQERGDGALCLCVCARACVNVWKGSGLVKHRQPTPSIHASRPTETFIDADTRRQAPIYII